MLFLNTKRIVKTLRLELIKLWWLVEANLSDLVLYGALELCLSDVVLYWSLWRLQVKGNIFTEYVILCKGVYIVSEGWRRSLVGHLLLEPRVLPRKTERLLRWLVELLSTVLASELRLLILMHVKAVLVLLDVGQDVILLHRCKLSSLERSLSEELKIIVNIQKAYKAIKVSNGNRHSEHAHESM